MSLMTSSSTIDLLLFLFFLFCLFYIYVLHTYRYWENRGIPFDKPKFPWGIFTDAVMLKKSFAEVYADAYIRTNHKFIGFFSLWSPGIIIKDLDLIKRIMLKDFNYFQDRGAYYNKEIDPLSVHLFTMEGSEWKHLRNKLTPTFTSGKMKMMFDIVVKCGEDLQNYVIRENIKSETIEWKDVFGRYGCTVIARTAFGLECNSFENSSSKFYNMIRMVTEPTLIQIFRFSLSFFGQNLAKLLNIRVIPKQVSDFYMSVVRDTVSYRESNSITRNDFMQLLIELKNKRTVQNRLYKSSEKNYKDNDMTLTMNQISAQAFLFFLAGFETTSNTMSFCIYELALNPNVQTKLHEEIDLLEGELTYEKINHMKYLDMVVNETLRKYPALGFINRICTRDYRMPEGELVIERGTLVIIPVHALHHNPEHFPDPQKFIPERFNEANINKIKPFSYLPFGDGPRNCIGMRFGKLQVKIGLVQLLKKFEFKVGAKTPLPVVFEPKALATTASGGMWLRAAYRHQ